MGAPLLLAPIGDVRPLVTPAREPLVQRLRLTLVSAGLALLGIPVALALAIVALLAVQRLLQSYIRNQVDYATTLTKHFHKSVNSSGSRIL